METLPLGYSGLRASALTLGCNALGHLDRAESRALLFEALDLGVTTFDTADVYAGGRSEIELGACLPRDGAITIISKFGHPSTATANTGPCHPDQVVKALEGSLRRLGREAVDLYLIHFPDMSTPVDDTLGALLSAWSGGKIRAWGASNFTGAHVEDLAARARHIGLPPPVMVQGEYNLLARSAEKELIPQVIGAGARFGAYFPLAGGLLTGKYRTPQPVASRLRQQAVRQFEQRFFTDVNFRRVEQLGRLAEGAGWSLGPAALAWLATRVPRPIIIAGASTPGQLHSNIAAVNDPLPTDLREMLDRASEDTGASNDRQVCIVASVPCERTANE